MNRLFVYGTLKPGHKNSCLLEKIGGTWQPASVKGILYEEGHPETEGYPALVLNDCGKKISGFLFSSDKLNKYWQELDEFEGHGYERVITVAELEKGNQIETYVYTLKRK